MQSHRDVLVARAQSEGWTRGVELGVGSGMLFERLLTHCPDLFVIGVDTFNRPDRRDGVRAIAERFPDRCWLHEMTTVEAAPFVSDESLDFVFVDAGHSYAAVSADIDAWWPKVKPGGWFGGHDYHEHHPGVMRAVQECFGDNRGLILEPFAIWWVRR
jgi:hypothetical protein